MLSKNMEIISSGRANPLLSTICSKLNQSTNVPYGNCTYKKWKQEMGKKKKNCVSWTLFIIINDVTHILKHVSYIFVKQIK